MTGNQAMVDIHSKTFWGLAEVQASPSTPESSAPCSGKKQLPTDTDGDKIADSWEMMPLNGATLALGGNDQDGAWDEETSNGNTKTGDGFAKLNEYKGILIGPEVGPPPHVRLHANRKDVFFQYDDSPTEGAAAQAGFGQLDVERHGFGGTNLMFLGSQSRTGIVFTDAGTHSATDNGIIIVGGVATGNNGVQFGLTGGPRNGSASVTLYNTSINNMYTQNTVPESVVGNFNWHVPVAAAPGHAQYMAVFDGTDLNGDGDNMDQVNPFDLLAPRMLPASTANNDALDGVIATLSAAVFRNRNALHEAGHGVGIASSVQGLSHPTTGASVMRQGLGPAQSGMFTATDTGQMKLK